MSLPFSVLAFAWLSLVIAILVWPASAWLKPVMLAVWSIFVAEFIARLMAPHHAPRESTQEQKHRRLTRGTYILRVMK
ncbi:MAG: hypothetical protein JO104_09100 [Candidatus Eremiobacteraeota bacterium]|nr:hypothetical protein [Candidatus Eremiobacteraeota bacterium]